MWDEVFKNGPSEIGGRHTLKSLKWYCLLKQTIHVKSFKGCLPQISLGPLFEYFLPCTLIDYQTKK